MIIEPEFERERFDGQSRMTEAENLHQLGLRFLVESSKFRYSYNFDWAGLPIIQFPPDIVAVQELLWRVRPGAVVETGVARGGSLMLSASVLELIGEDSVVIGVDVDIRPHNRVAIEEHPLSGRVRLVEGSSTDPQVVASVVREIGERGPVLVLLDSMHSHAHVLEELRLYSPLVSAGSYLVVFDTVIEDMPADAFPNRPWGPGDNPKTAVKEFLRNSDRFVIDHQIEDKLLITVAPSGYLRCVK